VSKSKTRDGSRTVYIIRWMCSIFQYVRLSSLFPFRKPDSSTPTPRTVDNDFFGMLHHSDMSKGIVLGVIFLGWCNIWSNVAKVIVILKSLSFASFHDLKSDATSAWWEGHIFRPFPTSLQKILTQQTRMQNIPTRCRAKYMDHSVANNQP
jgi:hypothetical protein